MLIPPDRASATQQPPQSLRYNAIVANDSGNALPVGGTPPRATSKRRQMRRNRRGAEQADGVLHFAGKPVGELAAFRGRDVAARPIQSSQAGHTRCRGNQAWYGCAQARSAVRRVLRDAGSCRCGPSLWPDKWCRTSADRPRREQPHRDRRNTPAYRNRSAARAEARALWSLRSVPEVSPAPERCRTSRRMSQPVVASRNSIQAAATAPRRRSFARVRAEASQSRTCRRRYNSTRRPADPWRIVVPRMCKALGSSDRPVDSCSRLQTGQCEKRLHLPNASP